MSFKVLSIDDPEWVSRIGQLPPDRRDIHFGPGVLAAYQVALGWIPCLAVTEDMNDFIIQPILITKDKKLRHAYNFGGAVGSLKADYDLGLMHRGYLNEWKNQNGITDEYCTLNPFIALHQQLLCAGVKPGYVKDTVWMDLTKEGKVRGTSRRLATKAHSSGVQVFSVGQSAIPLFYEMYNKTMERNEAKEHWYFPEAFFTALYRLTKATIMMALVDGKPESAAFLLHGYGGPVYYHFAGTLMNHPKLGVNHALVLASAEYAGKVLRATKLHLGGGVTPAANDSLLTFKAGFSDQRAPVWTYEVKSAA